MSKDNNIIPGSQPDCATCAWFDCIDGEEVCMRNLAVTPKPSYAGVSWPADCPLITLRWYQCDL